MLDKGYEPATKMALTLSNWDFRPAKPINWSDAIRLIDADQWLQGSILRALS
jgi:hypothetical protein